jgi:hypothetical protein
MKKKLSGHAPKIRTDRPRWVVELLEYFILLLVIPVLLLVMLALLKFHPGKYLCLSHKPDKRGELTPGLYAPQACYWVRSRESGSGSVSCDDGHVSLSNTSFS